MKLVKSNKAQTFHGLMIALNNVISLNTEPYPVLVDFTLYQGDIGLIVKKESESDGATVLIGTGPQEGDLRVAYFSNQTMVNGTFDPFGLKAAKGEGGFKREHKHKGFVPDEGFDYPKKMEELASVIVHFLVTGNLPDEAQLQEHFLTLARTIVSSGEPKLK